SDVSYNPVFYAYLLVGVHGHTLFLDKTRVTKQVYESLNADGVSFAAYESLPAFLQTLSSEDRILLPPQTTAVAWRAQCAHMKTGKGAGPIAAHKAAKTPEEVEALRLAMIRDGVAVVKSIRWVEQTAHAQGMKEFDIGRKTADFRAEGRNYV